jgi:hypothetical protein
MIYIPIVFKKKYRDRVINAIRGNVVKMEQNKANDLIERGLADLHTGEYPPKGKAKFNLKDLK